MKGSILTLIFICFLSFSNTAHAQLTSNGTDQSSISGQTSINTEIIPQNPGPNELVTVYLTSFSTNINSAKITWKVNGVTKKTGIGEKSFEFTAGDMNTTTKLEIIAETPDGEIVRNNFDIKPTEVDLMWQADSYVPPFYKGKAMYTHQDSITFIAFPHMTSANGQEIPPKNLIYKWTRNGIVMDSDSGYGKNTLRFTGPLISRPLKVEVSVTSTETSGTAYTHTTVAPKEPSVAFYRKHPLYGIEFQKALTNTEQLNDSKEIIVVGIPYFFGTLFTANSNLNYKWSINGAKINNDLSSNIEVFRQKEGTSGVSQISLSIENSEKILQYASVNFNLMFGSNSAPTSTF